MFLIDFALLLICIPPWEAAVSSIDNIYLCHLVASYCSCSTVWI